MATSGVRWWIIWMESAHEAQKAEGAQRTADRNPRPPIRMGNVANA